MRPATLFREYIWLVSTIRRAGELTATPEHTDFEPTLRPTADFITPLLSRDAAIRVLSPQWLALAASRYE